jgi:hypothetical protein
MKHMEHGKAVFSARKSGKDTVSLLNQLVTADRLSCGLDKFFESIHPLFFRHF